MKMEQMGLMDKKENRDHLVQLASLDKRGTEVTTVKKARMAKLGFLVRWANLGKKETLVKKDRWDRLDLLARTEAGALRVFQVFRDPKEIQGPLEKMERMGKLV